ncbi:MAG: HD domain-containing phosphohydrolase [Bacteroidota bacterium]
MPGPILIVDDEPINLARLRDILEPHYDVVFARNGGEAMAAVEKHAPGLVLLDVLMPDMDGYEVCRRLKGAEATQDIPVIFVTTQGSEWHEEAGFTAGGVDYITKPVSAVVVNARVRTHMSLVRAKKLEDAHRDAIFMLGEAGHYRDSDTGVHIWRMAAYTRALAEAAGWPAHQVELIELAAPMHDTGKIGIPDAILKKPAALDEAEWQIMKEHTRIGYTILSRSKAPLFQMAAEVALNHHERWDGSGYPVGRSGDAIPESARIIALADVFDALSMRRPYKDVWPIERVIPYMESNVNHHFDPRLFAVFQRIFPRILAIKEEWGHREAQANWPSQH